QQNGSLEPNPQEKPQDSPKETPPIQEPETKESEQQPSELAPPKVTISQPEQQQPPPSGQPKDNQRETSQPSLSKPGLKNDQGTSNIPPKVPSSEQKDSGGDTEHQKCPQSDSKEDAQTPVPNKRGSDDGPDGGSRGSNYGKKDIDKGSLNPGGIPGDQGNADNGSGDGLKNSNGGAEDTDKRPLNTGGGQDDKEGSEGGSGSPPVENGTQSMPGEPFNMGSFIFKISLKGMEKLNDVITSLETIKNRFTDATKHIHNLYNTTLPSIKNGFDKSIDFFNDIINSINIDFKQVDTPAGSGDSKSEPGGTGSGSPPSDDPSPPPKGLDQTSQSSQTLQNPQAPQASQNSLLPSSTEQTKPHQSPQDPPGSQHSDPKGQEGPQKPVGDPMLKPEHPGSEVKGNETIGIGDIYIFKGYKQFVILTIVLLIPIALAIMYKYLSFGRRNELKKKNNMKKVINIVGVNKTTKTVINSTDGKKQIKIIIKSSSRKKQIKKSINSVYGGKSPSLNIYQLMQADPVP
ncbi:hypothetical protein, conserved, partial [Plasmodium chabaudi adami]